MSLDYLAQEIGGPIPPIRGIGGIPVEPVGFVMMNVKVPCVQGYDEDQIAIVMDDPDMSECPVILGTSLFTVLWKRSKKVRFPSWLCHGPHHKSLG